jgi:transcriptional regulator with GAF, ATPase, and Fis domain
VLQEKKIERVGGADPVHVDARIIAATHRDLKRLVQEGKFREDLFYRLDVFPITIPALRRRKVDIPAFVRHFMDRKIKELNLAYRPDISAQGLERLLQYDWPGNVRELENAIERELIRSQAEKHDTAEITLRFEDIGASQAHLPAAAATVSSGPEPGRMALEQVFQVHVEQALRLTNGKIQGKDGAAALLGVNPSTLRHRLRKLGIVFGRERKKHQPSKSRKGRKK